MPRWSSEPEGAERLSDAVAQHATPLIDDRDLDPVVAAIGDARYVLLGEASHGTSEYYTWRARLTRRLVEEKDFRFVAVEGDWPDCMRVDRFVRSLPESEEDAREVLRGGFHRWPTWMWANEEVADFAQRLREHNWQLPERERVGFYGIDLYSLWESMHALMEYLEDSMPDAVPAAQHAFDCFEPFGRDPQEYARATMFVPDSCQDEVVELLSEIRAHPHAVQGSSDTQDRFEAEMNALVAKNAENYYRTMVRGGGESWNVRDRHMVEALERLMKHGGPGAKCVVWEHNTHVGDARATDMYDAGMVNVGQLLREAHDPEEVFICGFGSYRGSVVAGSHWDAPMQRMPVPPARGGSWEDIFHTASPEDKLLLMDDLQEEDLAFRPRGHRAIGVVYNPEHDAWGNFVPTVLAERYDAFLYIDQTRALRPLHAPTDWAASGVDETYPFGL